MGIVSTTTMQSLTASILASLALFASSCTGYVQGRVVTKSPRTVSVEVEVYDPVTNLVWKGVSVRVVEGAMEWSSATIKNSDPDDWLLTGNFGTVLFDAHELTHVGIGFMEDDSRRAILTADVDEDEAYVLVEIAAEGFNPAQVDVKVTWDKPNVFVSVPFTPIGS